jgi:hypothetical protein
MLADLKDRVYDFVVQTGDPVSVNEIKKRLAVAEPNVVESVVLSGLNSGRLELTPEGVRIRAKYASA